eukprot:15469622-Alexandrium_andersonii.AAC.1
MTVMMRDLFWNPEALTRAGVTTALAASAWVRQRSLAVLPHTEPGRAVVYAWLGQPFVDIGVASQHRAHQARLTGVASRWGEHET